MPGEQGSIHKGDSSWGLPVSPYSVTKLTVSGHPRFELCSAFRRP